KEPELAAEAAAAFRNAIGTDRVLTRVGIDKKTVSFGTNIPDKSLIVTSSMPVTQTFTWDLNGLQRRLGSIDVPAPTSTPSPPSFGIGDVDWKILSKLQESAIAKADARIGFVEVLTRSNLRPRRTSTMGRPQLRPPKAKETEECRTYS